MYRILCSVLGLLAACAPAMERVRIDGPRFTVDGRPWMPWIHLADEVAALRLLIDDPRASGPFNLSAPAPARQRDFHRALSRALRRPAFLVVPALALRLALGEMSSLVLASDRALPRRLAGLGFRHRFEELGAALSELFG